ncbi:MAG: hypothetical protein KDG50_15895 [Chromatiales bacterium]|nr:hypothetical protein [Chromatiales bacterium]
MKKPLLAIALFAALPSAWASSRAVLAVPVLDAPGLLGLGVLLTVIAARVLRRKA